MIQIPIDPPLTELKIEDYNIEQQPIIEENLRRLPFLFDENCEPFVGFHHLHSLYRESYFCILNGFYHAGIITMSQLLEEVLREIIRVHTGVTNGSAFEGLLAAMSQSSKVTSKPYLIHPELVNQLTIIKEEFRNPYTHLRYKKIFKGRRLPAALIHIGTDPKKLVENIKSGIESVRTGKTELKEYDPSSDPVVSSYLKEDIDKVRSIQLAWKIYPLYWLLMEEYLNKDIAELALQQFGDILNPEIKKIGVSGSYELLLKNQSSKRSRS